jgi:hypothetical protein
LSASFFFSIEIPVASFQYSKISVTKAAPLSQAQDNILICFINSYLSSGFSNNFLYKSSLFDTLTQIRLDILENNCVDFPSLIILFA